MSRDRLINCTFAAAGLVGILLGATVGCGATATTRVVSLGAADDIHSLNQDFGPGTAEPVVGTELRFTLTSTATVLVIGSITYSIIGGTDYAYPNLEVDRWDGGLSGAGHHFAALDSDGGDAITSASWTRVETLAPGVHTARLSMDVQPDTAARVFTGMVRAIQLG